MHEALGGERHRHGETIHSHPHGGPRVILRITAVIARPISGSAIGRPKATTTALAT
jgi:hypothetical protein